MLKMRCRVWENMALTALLRFYIAAGSADRWRFKEKRDGIRKNHIQTIERKHLNLRVRIQRLAHSTIHSQFTHYPNASIFLCGSDGDHADLVNSDGELVGAIAGPVGQGDDTITRNAVQRCQYRHALPPGTAAYRSAGKNSDLRLCHPARELRHL